MRSRAHEDIGGEPALRQQLGQRAGVAETVGVEADFRGRSEARLKVALAKQRLADESLAARQVAIGLYPPAADGLPAAFRNAGLDLLEHLRLIGLDPLVVGG